MNLFIEKEFIEKFESEYEFNNIYSNSNVKNIVYRLLSEYPFVTLYTNYANLKEAMSSRLINFFTNNNTSINFIVDFDKYFESISELPLRTLVFTESPSKSSALIATLGGLHFSYDGLEMSLGEFIQTFEQKIDFSEIENFTWNTFSILSKVPFRSIVIDDPYILLDKADQKIDKNLVPMLKNLISEKSGTVELCIYTDIIQNSSERGRSEIDIVEMKYSRIMKQLSENINSFSLVKSKQKRNYFEQHDRYCYMDFVIISAGKGFNVVPFRVGNTSIDIKTIFDKSSYRQLLNHLVKLKEMNRKLYKLETVDSKFNYYPKEAVNNRLLS